VPAGGGAGAERAARPAGLGRGLVGYDELAELLVGGEPPQRVRHAVERVGAIDDCLEGAVRTGLRLPASAKARATRARTELLIGTP